MQQGQMSEYCQSQGHYIWNDIFLDKHVACLHPIALTVLNRRSEAVYMFYVWKHMWTGLITLVSHKYLAVEWRMQKM